MWQVVKCAVQGLGHVDKNIPCQDKVYNLTELGTTTIALADGCGSAKLSHFGAEVVTEFVCKKLCQDFDTIFNEENGIKVKTSLINDIKEQLTILSENKQVELKELASTLLFVAVKDNNFIGGHIGDGVMAYLKGDELKVSQMPKKEGAVNETFFTTSSCVFQQMQVIRGSLDEIRGFVLMSDGTEVSLYDKRKEQMADIVKKIMLMCNTHRGDVLEKMLQLSFESTVKERTTDDCSIIFMYNVLGGNVSWRQLSSKELLKLFELSSTNINFRIYCAILKLLTKGQCSLDRMYAWFHINKKEKKDMLKYYLQELQRLQVIAEVAPNVYSLFIK